jgi:hypothetical protein
MPAWWLGLAVLSLATTYLPMPGKEMSAVTKEIAALTGRRAGYARFLRLVDAEVTQRPALVLVEQGLVNSWVVNSPGLDGPVIFGRYRPSVHSLEEIARAFPERAIYLFDGRDWRIERVGVPAGASDGSP